METLAENRKAFFDYEILEKFQAGLQLKGWEVKSIKSGKVSLTGTRVLIRAGEAFIVGMNITPYQASNITAGGGEDEEKQRTIKLLLKKKEIMYLDGKLNQKGLTVVPLKLYNINRRVKVDIALAKGKKSFDKRETVKKRETEREIRRTLKGE